MKDVIREEKKMSNPKLSKLDIFSLGFEYDMTLRDINKSIKLRTIK